MIFGSPVSRWENKFRTTADVRPHYTCELAETWEMDLRATAMSVPFFKDFAVLRRTSSTGGCCTGSLRPTARSSSARSRNRNRFRTNWTRSCTYRPSRIRWNLRNTINNLKFHYIIIYRTEIYVIPLWIILFLRESICVFTLMVKSYLSDFTLLRNNNFDVNFRHYYDDECGYLVKTIHSMC